MGPLSRRSVLRGSFALAAAGTLARPHIANAAATTATVWWTQGFVPEEDISIKKIFDDYQKASGNTLDYTIMPYAPMRQKDRRSSDQRRGARSVPKQSGRNPRAIRLAGQTG